MNIIRVHVCINVASTVIFYRYFFTLFTSDDVDLSFSCDVILQRSAFVSVTSLELEVTRVILSSLDNVTLSSFTVEFTSVSVFVVTGSIQSRGWLPQQQNVCIFPCFATEWNYTPLFLVTIEVENFDVFLLDACTFYSLSDACVEGSCVLDDDMPMCSCSLGYAGEFCSEDVSTSK